MMRVNIKACTLVAMILSLFSGSITWADETDLAWGTFLGGDGYDEGRGIAIDSSGNSYVTGETQSANFPTTAGVFDESYNGYSDIFVAKLNSQGNVLEYVTFIGGSSDEIAKSIAVNSIGTACVTGETYSSDFPTTAGAFDETYNIGADAFVVKLNPMGSALDYSTFMGGNSTDWGTCIALDGLSNAYVTGWTSSVDFPTVVGAYDITHNGSVDVFVAKLNSAGIGLEYSTFLGGSDLDHGYGIALDDSGKAYVTGRTWGAGFPVTTGAYDIVHNGMRDVFVTKLNATGSDLEYSTFLGGSDWEWANGIVVDGAGCAYVNGRTFSIDFPTTAGAFATIYNGGDADAFVTKLNSAGSDIEYSTFLGGSDVDGGSRGMAVDDSGNVFVTGFTHSADFPTTAGAYDVTFNGFVDVFVTKLNPGGSALAYSTFLGGSDRDMGEGGVALDDSGNVYVTGGTSSYRFPTTPGAFDPTFNGAYDAFVVRLGMVSTPVETETPSVGLPETYSLHQNYPNPFNADTEIRYQLPENCHVILKIFNSLGQQVKTLVDVDQLGGECAVNWDGRDEIGREVASGLYFCRLKAGEFGKTIKMVLMR